LIAIRRAPGNAKVTAIEPARDHPGSEPCLALKEWSARTARLMVGIIKPTASIARRPIWRSPLLIPNRRTS
jgi:hypothetical protein